MTPLLKWAGGKARLLPELVARMPAAFGRYYEPFAGGAALFFALRPERAVLGDSCGALIATYRAVAASPEAVTAELERHRAAHSPEHYYAVREQWNTAQLDGAEHAAALLYLNRTCYNGLWRVNRGGAFNVPVGRYRDPLAGLGGRVAAAAPALARAELRASDYRAVLDDARRGDFVYLDPPYDGTFTAYTPSAFGEADQAELAFEIRALAKRGVHVMASNADTPRIRALYAGLRIDRVRCGRAINSDASRRGAVDEVIVTAGYEPDHSTRCRKK